MGFFGRYCFFSNYLVLQFLEDGLVAVLLKTKFKNIKKTFKGSHLSEGWAKLVIRLLFTMRTPIWRFSGAILYVQYKSWIVSCLISSKIWIEKLMRHFFLLAASIWFAWTCMQWICSLWRDILASLTMVLSKGIKKCHKQYLYHHGNRSWMVAFLKTCFIEKVLTKHHWHKI